MKTRIGAITCPGCQQPIPIHAGHTAPSDGVTVTDVDSSDYAQHIRTCRKVPTGE